MKLFKHERKNNIINLLGAISYSAYGKNNEFTIVKYNQKITYILGVSWLEFQNFMDSDDAIGEGEYKLLK